MKKLISWILGILTVFILAGVITLFAIKLALSEDKVAPDQTQDKPTAEQQVIIDKAFDANDAIASNEASTTTMFFQTMHEMANTKIVAEDGHIWGLKAITKNRVEAMKKAVIVLKIKDDQINEILDRWSKKDFSQGVEDHNYVWSKYLNGEVGKAKSLMK